MHYWIPSALPAKDGGRCENTSEGYQLIDQLGPNLCTLPNSSHREFLVCVLSCLPPEVFSHKRQTPGERSERVHTCDVTQLKLFLKSTRV